MKLTLSILMLALLLLVNVSDSNAQEKNAELEKLKAQLAQIGESDSFEIDISGDTETSGTIKIRVVRDVSVTTGINKNNTIITTTKTKKKKITLPEIDLSKISVSDEIINEKFKLDALPVAKCGEINGVGIIQVGVSRDYLVTDNYIYDSDKYPKLSEPYSITVFKNYKYDRASIPRFLWGIIDKDSLGNVAPLIHDLLYEYGGCEDCRQIKYHLTGHLTARKQIRCFSE